MQTFFLIFNKIRYLNEEVNCSEPFPSVSVPYSSSLKYTAGPLTMLFFPADVGENISWFAVFDGHAGSRVSAHCSDHLVPTLSLIYTSDLPV
jgi:hypothetical protein